MTTQQFDFPMTSELRNLLRALRVGLAEGSGFSPVDTVSMGLLCLKEDDQNITIASVLNYIERHIWPTMVHDLPMAYGDASFTRMRATYEALVAPTVKAMRQDDPASELLRLDQATNGRFATGQGIWEE